LEFFGTVVNELAVLVVRIFVVFVLVVGIFVVKVFIFVLEVVQVVQGHIEEAGETALAGLVVIVRR
jgi:hypothetical protein